MKKFGILALLLHATVASASPYDCELKVENSRVNLESQVVFDGNTAVNSTLDHFNFQLFKTTQSTGEETYVLAISHPTGASSTIFTPGSALVAHAVNSGEPGAIVQSICRLR